MAITATKILLEGGNILIKDATDKIIKILISHSTHAHNGDTSNIIYLNSIASDREEFQDVFPIDVNLITMPVPPLGGWTQTLLLQELSDNFIGKPIKSEQSTLLEILTAINNSNDVGIELGDVSGYSARKKFGRIQNLATAFKEIWPENINYPFPTSASIRTVSSTNANDTVAGTGGRTVLIKGLDANYDEVTEIVNLNGLSASNTVNSYIRINEFQLLTAGSSGSHIGTLYLGSGTLTAGKPATVLGLIDFVLGTPQAISQQAIFTVPRGKTAIVTQIETFTDQADNAIQSLKVKPFGGVNTYYGTTFTYQAVYASEFKAIEIPEKSDISLVAAASSGIVNVTGRMDLILKDTII